MTRQNIDTLIQRSVDSLRFREHQRVGRGGRQRRSDDEILEKLHGRRVLSKSLLNCDRWMIREFDENVPVLLDAPCLVSEELFLIEHQESKREDFFCAHHRTIWTHPRCEVPRAVTFLAAVCIFGTFWCVIRLANPKKVCRRREHEY